MTARPAMSRPMATSSGWVVGVPLRLVGIEDVAQGHQLARPVGHLDADGRLARDGGQDAHVGRGHGVGDVLGQAGDPGHLDPGAELELVAGDGRADPAADQAGLDAVGGQRAHQVLAGRVELALVLVHLLGGVQERHGRAAPTRRARAWRPAPVAGSTRRLDRLGLGVERDVDVPSRVGRLLVGRCVLGDDGAGPARRPHRVVVVDVLDGDHERLAPPERARAAARGGCRPRRDARPTAARGTPVAIRMATRTTATRRTAAPAGPRPACSGRPTTAPR